MTDKPRQINFRLPEADARSLDALAAAEHRSTPDYVRSMALAHIEARTEDAAELIRTGILTILNKGRAPLAAVRESRIANRPSKKDAYLRERKP
jgi:predicted transcriptional regulator